MQEEGAGECGGVMHCFTEDWDMASKALDMGFYLSFSGIITFNSAEELRAVVKKVPEDRLLIETDAPYLSPVPKRGKPNYPSYVHYVAECMADTRGVSPEEIAATTKDNFNRLFKLTL
jgi:TatD DNase family protein